MVIKRVEIEKFRALKNISFDLGNKLTAIAGKNGTLKTTILGIISQTFSLANKDHPLNGEKTIDGYNLRSQFGEKFKLSNNTDKPGQHKWKVFVNKNIYNQDDGIYEAVSISRYDSNKSLRFWNAKSKVKGTGYIQCPVVYLSLKRLYPIGEISGVTTDKYELTTEENDILKKWYKKIFTEINTKEYDISALKSSTKTSASIFPIELDPITISAGQDNIGKILVTLLSFRRLKNKYPTEYKGGIILIDELEASLHSSALIHLLEIFMKVCGEYNLQIIFTTHSEDIVIKTLLSAQYSIDNKVLYLKKVDGEILLYDKDLTYPQIKSDLGNINLPKNEYLKPRVYTEDGVALQLLKGLLPREVKSKYEFVSLSLGEGEYRNLLDSKCKEFLNSIIVLDGDQVNNPKILKYKNVTTLPGTELPEKFLYNYLYKLPESDKIWNNKVGGYDKAKCFNNSIDVISKDGYKNWFYNEKSNFGRGLSKLINSWKENNKDEYQKFLDRFLVCEEYINR